MAWLVVDGFSHFFAAAPRCLFHISPGIAATANLIFFAGFPSAHATHKHGHTFHPALYRVQVRLRIGFGIANYFKAVSTATAFVQRYFEY